MKLLKNQYENILGMFNLRISMATIQFCSFQTKIVTENV